MFGKVDVVATLAEIGSHSLKGHMSDHGRGRCSQGCKILRAV